MPYTEIPAWPLLMLNAGPAHQLLDETAQEAADAANSYSPTGKVTYESAPAEPGPGGLPEAAMGTDSPLWHIIEFGSAKYAGVFSPAYAPIRNGAESVGLDLEFTGAGG